MFRDILKVIAGVLDFLREAAKPTEKKKQKKLDVSGTVWDRPLPPPPRAPRPDPFEE